jgi:hypothetical protein
LAASPRAARQRPEYRYAALGRTSSSIRLAISDRAFDRSYAACRFSRNAGVVLKYRLRRSAVSGVTARGFCPAVMDVIRFGGTCDLAPAHSRST